MVVLNGFSNKMITDVDMFHPQVKLVIKCEHDGALIVAVQRSGCGDRHMNLGDEISQPQNILQCISHRNVLGFC